MTYLLTQIFFCLLVAAAIGAVTAWFLRQRIARRREAIMQHDWRARLHEVETDRERTVRRLSDKIAALEGAAPKSIDGVDALRAEYEELLSRLEDRVAERESVIAELRGEIGTLRAELADVTTAGRQTATAAAADEALRRSRERESLEARIAALQANVAEREQRLQSTSAQLQAARTAVGEHERALAEQRSAAAVREDDGEQPSAARIAELEAAIRQRDDTIAVLRDDLAQFAGQEVIESRGRQDEQLRAALGDALEWERRYTATAETLADRERRIAELEKRLDATGGDTGRRRGGRRARMGVAGESRRSAGERIGAVVAGAPATRDNLRAIRGIGPALERMLNELGIFHYRELAELDGEGVARIAREIGRFGDRIVRDDWVGQARRLAAGRG